MYKSLTNIFLSLSNNNYTKTLACMHQKKILITTFGYLSFYYTHKDNAYSHFRNNTHALNGIAR